MPRICAKLAFWRANARLMLVCHFSRVLSPLYAPISLKFSTFILFYFILSYLKMLFYLIKFILISYNSISIYFPLFKFSFFLFYFILFYVFLSYFIFYCQAQLQLSAQLKAELALFPLNPATHPHPGKFISEL